MAKAIRLSDLVQNKPDSEEERPSINGEGIATLPAGYRWCNECNAATPHAEDEKKQRRCVLCGTWPFSESCDNCGWEPPEDIFPSEFTEVLHRADCEVGKKEASSLPHFEIVRPDEQVRKIRAGRFDKETYEGPVADCGCPKIIAYRTLNVFDYVESPAYSLDCYNAMEWHYKIRCPICGDIFEIWDGNC